MLRYDYLLAISDCQKLLTKPKNRVGTYLSIKVIFISVEKCFLVSEVFNMIRILLL